MKAQRGDYDTLLCCSQFIQQLHLFSLKAQHTACLRVFNHCQAAGCKFLRAWCSKSKIATLALCQASEMDSIAAHLLTA